MHTTTPEFSDTAAAFRLARNMAVVAGVFTAIVCAILLADFGRRMAKDPFEQPEFKRLKAAQAADPTNEELKADLRQLDLELRRRYFLHRRFAAFGAVLLLGGSIVTLAAGKWAATLRRRLPAPGPQTGPQDRETGRHELARVAVAAVLGILVGGALVAGLAFPTLLPEEAELAAIEAPGPSLPADAPAHGPAPEDGEKSPPDGGDGTGAAAAVSAAPTEPHPDADRDPAFAPIEERMKYWGRFRGPGGAGISAYAKAPTSWNDATGEGIVWKTPVPLPGKSSPVVWKNRVFLTGATQEKREVYCFDAASGKLLWARAVPGTPESTAKELEVSADTGLAAPTAVTDGRRVFAIFANGDVGAFDFEGRLVWARSMGVPENHYGHASSLEVFENLVFVLIDQGRPKDARSRLYALEATTGKTVWEKPREVEVSWATPGVAYHDGKPQLLTAATPWVIAYRPSDGEVLWRCKKIEGEHGVSPVYNKGVVQVGSEYCAWFAIKADGQGDVTETHVLWEGYDGLPDQCSPLAFDQHVTILGTWGTLTCYDAASGDVRWTKEFDMAKFTSSPGLAGGLVYLFGEVDTEEEDAEGNVIVHSKAWVFKPGEEDAEEVGTGLLLEGCVTSPAFQDGRIFIRGSKHLYCLGNDE